MRRKAFIAWRHLLGKLVWGKIKVGLIQMSIRHRLKNWNNFIDHTMKNFLKCLIKSLNGNFLNIDTYIYAMLYCLIGKLVIYVVTHTHMHDVINMGMHMDYIYVYEYTKWTLLEKVTVIRQHAITWPVVNSSPPWTNWPPFCQTTFSNAFSWMKIYEFP